LWSARPEAARPHCSASSPNAPKNDATLGHALAGLCLAREDLSQASAHVEEILGYLETGPIEGTDDPIWVSLICYRVLLANGDPRAPPILATAHALLQERAARIDDENLRRSFMERVPSHREIVRAFATR